MVITRLVNEPLRGFVKSPFQVIIICQNRYKSSINRYEIEFSPPLDLTSKK